MSDRTSVPDWLFRILRQVTGLQVELGAHSKELSIAVSGGSATTFECVHMPVISQERANDLIAQRRSSPRHWPILLLATRQLGAPTRELLRRENISWVEELSGTCRLSAPGLLVDTKVATHPTNRLQSNRTRLLDKSGVIAETLLLQFRTEQIRLSDLARLACASAALASRVLTRLAELKLVTVHGSGPNRFWKLSDPGGLLDTWANEELQAVQTTYLYVWSGSPDKLIKKLEALNQLSTPWALGGTAAANLYAPTLTINPDPAVWIDSRVSASEVAHLLDGELVEKGSNVQLWQSGSNAAFRNSVRSQSQPDLGSARQFDLCMVSMPRAYVEAAHVSGRSPEVARNLRERILSNAIS